MTDITITRLIARLRSRARDLEGLYGTGSTAPLLAAAADALEACKTAAERALGATASTAEEAVELLATEHLNLQRELEAARATNQLLAYPGLDAEGNLLPQPPLSSLLDGPDPAPVDLPRRRDLAPKLKFRFAEFSTIPPFQIHDFERSEACEPSRNGPCPARPEFSEEVREYLRKRDSEAPRAAPGTISIVGGDGETIRALGLPEACTHARTMPGPEIPLRHGSWCSEVCRGCGKWRFVGHNGAQVGAGTWRSDSLEELAQPREEDT